MAPYGLPSAYSTEKEVLGKTPRRVAPVAVEVNAEGVVQLDGLATRGMSMFGGPNTYQRQVTIVPPGINAVTLAANQLVDGILVVGDGGALTTVTLPSVLAVNAFVNSNLVSGAAALAFPVATATAPRTTFKLTVITNQRIDFLMPALTPVPGHAVGASGYQGLNLDVQPADMTVTTVIAPANPRTNVITIANSTPRQAIDVYFIQTAGTGSDPEWIILCN
jgi:hypothetical protein